MDGHRAPAGLGRSRAPARRAPSRPCRFPGPGLKRAQGRPARRDRRPPASWRNWRGDVSSRTARAGGQLVERGDGCAVCTVPPQAAQLGGQAPGDGRAAALDHRPAGAVAEGSEQQPERRGQGRSQRLHGVGRRAGQERPGRVRGEALGQVAYRGHAGPGEAGQGQRVARDACASVRARRPRSGPANPPAAPPAPGRRRRRRPGATPSRPRRGRGRRPGRPSRGWAKASSGWRSTHAERPRIQRAEERRRHERRVDGGAHIVGEPGQRQLFGARSAPDSGRSPRIPRHRCPPGPGSAPRPGRWGPTPPRRRRRAPWTDVTGRARAPGHVTGLGRALAA